MPDRHGDRRQHENSTPVREIDAHAAQRGAIDTITPTTIARLVERQDRQTPRATQFLGRWIADGRRRVARRQR
jgi:hypothetical protein